MEDWVKAFQKTISRGKAALKRTKSEPDHHALEVDGGMPRGGGVLVDGGDDEEYVSYTTTSSSAFSANMSTTDTSVRCCVCR